MPGFQLATNEEKTTKERQRKQDEGHPERSLEGQASSKGPILKKSKDSYLLIPQKKTRITLDDVMNFLKNF
jgi:hypothetical protein